MKWAVRNAASGENTKIVRFLSPFSLDFSGPGSDLVASTIMPEPTSLTIASAQQRVDEWIHSIGVRYFSELTNLAQLMEEVGELARLFARTYGDQSAKSGDVPAELSDELADIFFVLICLANQTGVDLTEAFETNLAKKTTRDRDRHLNNPKLTGE